MRNLKKFLALVLAMMMVMSLMLTVNAATPATFGDRDEINSTYAEAVNVLSALSIIKGDAGGSDFRPKDPITRAEVAAMLYRIAANDAGEKQVKIYSDYKFFNDVTSDKWYAGAVNYCANSEYIKGVGGDNFEPWRDITGYEVLAMTLRVLGYGQNGEFEGSGWMVQTARYGRLAGLTKNISSGTLGDKATREMVAEVMFQALQADLVEYNMLLNYHAARTLIADTAENREAYADSIEADLVVLPLNADLMYENYGIVGKSPNLTYDKYGRPSEMWVKDLDSDITSCSVHTADDPGDEVHGDAEKYVPNLAGDEGTPQKAITVKMTPAATYHNAVTECQVSKDLGDDTTQDWKNIAEVLNGNTEATLDNVAGLGKTHTMDYDGGLGVNHKDGQSFDALHTSDKWIGATGRTTEIYDISAYGVDDKNGEPQNYIIVYVDTFLGKVTEITEAINDPNGHEIKPATATVKIGKASGSSAELVSLSLSSAGKHNVGDLVLVQTASGGATTAIDDIDAVEVGEKAPAVPADVPIADTQFVAADCTLLPDETGTKQVTIKATVGVRDDKMGIITTDDETIYASNTFLAAKNTDAPTVLDEWYDVDQPTKGITNSMIGRTYDLILDQNGYIVGMKEVLTINSTVGVITGIDTDRAGMGKYVSVVEAYMTDGTTQTFNVIDMGATEFGHIASGDPIDTKAFSFFANSAACDTAWDDGGTYGDKMGVGSLVMFKQCTVDGISAWYFADTSDLSDTPDATAATDKFLWNAATNKMNAFGAIGKPLTKDTGAVKTGVALTLETTLDLDAIAPAPTNISKQLDDKSIVFVAEPEYRYNTGNANEGANSVKYNVYEGFRTLPTITAANNKAEAAGGTIAADTYSNILYQQLINNPEYVLVYPQNLAVEYIIRNQSTIAVDDSYLVLSRGATYAQYSEYNVLKNGKADVLKVSNSNDTLNTKIEAAMAAGDLLTVTGRNGVDWVISVETVENLANATPANAVAVANCGGVLSAATHPNPLVAGAATTLFSVNDGVINFNDTQADRALTLADGCTVQLVNLGTGAVKDISLGVAKTYINNEGGNLQSECDFTFELDQYGYVCSLYVIEK